MTRPSEQLIKMMRSLMTSKKLTVAKMALQSEIERGLLRRLLAGRETLTVDQMFAIFNVLEIGPDDLGKLGLSQDDLRSTDEPSAPSLFQPNDKEEGQQAMNPFGNHAEQLLKAGFELGADFRFLADPSKLTESGIPQAVLDAADSRGIAIQLAAVYHDHNTPEFYDTHFEVTLSFDALYRVKFGWDSISSVTFFPEAPVSTTAAEEEKAQGVPHLRLVT